MLGSRSALSSRVSDLSGVTACWLCVLSATAGGLGLCACVHCGPWPCGWDVQRCPATGQPCSASRCVLCRGITSDRRTCDRTAPPCSRSSTESARAASQGSEGPSVGL